VIFKASLGDGVIVLHQALIEDAAIPPGLMVPSMSAVRNKEDVLRLAPASPELAEFALKVCQTNVFLTEVSSLIRSTGKSDSKGD
jgi:carbonic anhydrase/acetyltransferase-like protein (isoleucine patch superfamily)